MPDTRKVVIAYSPDKERVGKVEELPVDEAKALVKDSRARYLTGDEEKNATVGEALPDGSHTVVTNVPESQRKTAQQAKKTEDKA